MSPEPTADRASAPSAKAARWTRFLLASAAVLALTLPTACAPFYHHGPHEQSKHPRTERPRAKSPRAKSPRAKSPRHSCRVPRGHRPPRGMCRVWHPGTPPGHQPPPGSCRELRHRVPAGACLVRGR